MRTPEELVMDVENDLNRSFGPNIKDVLIKFAEEMDKRYETNEY